VLGQVDCPALWRAPQARGQVPVQLRMVAPPPDTSTTQGAVGGASQAPAPRGWRNNG
jgi:hypothetical protein